MIQIARETVHRGADITISWAPDHAGVPDNEKTDQWAVEAAVRESRSRLGKDRCGVPGQTGRNVSQTFMKSVLKRRAGTKWREEIARGGRGRRPYRVLGETEVPRIPRGLQGVPKELESRFFQLSSGHAMIAPFLKKFGWTDSDSCWWYS